MAQSYRELRPKSWPDLKELFWVLSVGGWVFRGQRDAGWPITSSLERAIPPSLMGQQDEKKEKDMIGKFLEEMEYPVFAKFSERLDQYVGPEAGADTMLGRMALMQHHGVPTRLVDFTESPYVATYFAVEDAADPQGECAIWVISLPWCQAKSVQAVRKMKKLTEKDFPDNADFSNDDVLGTTVFDLHLALVAPLRPSRLNARIASQQGLFLCPGEMNITFMENLRSLGASDLPDILFKIVFPSSWRGMILYDLHSMNIGPHTLFPGLDGFARSIKLQLGLEVEYPRIEEEILQYTGTIAAKLGL